MAASSSSTSSEPLPEHVVQALLEDFDASSDGDDGTASEEDDTDDVFNGYSDVSDDSDDDETRQLLTTLSFLDAEEVPAYNFTKKEVVHVMPVFQPDTTPGPTCTVPPGDGNVLDFFQLFYDDGFFERIVRFTNLQAEMRQRAGINTYGAWVAITVDELKAYYAVRLFIETLLKDRLQSVWQQHANSDTWLLAMPGIASVFSRRRYSQITHLHYCDESLTPPRDDMAYDKLYKVRLLTDHLGRRFAEEYTPHEQVAVDECMGPFRGRLSFKQFHKDKPTKWGIKVWMLVDSYMGYNYAFDVYTGTDTYLDGLTNIG